MTDESEIKKCKDLIKLYNLKGINRYILETYIHSCLDGSTREDEQLFSPIEEDNSRITSFQHQDNFIKELREKDIFHGEIKSNGGKNGTRT